MEETKQKSSNHWCIFVTCLLLYGLGGGVMFYTAALFIGPIVADFNCPVSAASLGITLRALTAALVLPLWTRIWRTGKHTKLCMIGGLLIMMSTFVLLSLSPSLIFYYIFEILQGFCTAMILHLPVATLITNWFNKYRGTLIGLCMASAGIFSAIATPFISMLIADFGWRAAYRIMALAIGALLIVLELLFIYFRPADKGLTPFGYSEKAAAADITKAAISGVPLAKAKKSIDFKLIALLLGIGMIAGGFSTFVTGSATEISGGIAAVGTMATSCCMLGLGLGTIGIGFLCDKLGSKLALVIMASCGVAGALLVVFSGGSTIILYIGFFLLPFGLSVAQTGANILTSQRFGNMDYAAIWGALSPILAGVAAISTTALGFIYDLTGTYVGIVVLVGAVFATEIVLSTLIAKRKPLEFELPAKKIEAKA